VTTFDNWCALNDVQPLPAAPADIARFVTDCATLGIEKVWPMVQEISRAHYTVGLADPTLGGWVSTAINDIARIDPPRSWPKDHKARFLALPYDVQMYVAAHDMQREKEIRRAQNEAAESRQKQRKTNGITSHNAA
jgi:hypothetical protein